MDKTFCPRRGVLSGFVFNTVHRGTLPLASPGTLDGSLRLAHHHTIGLQLVEGRRRFISMLNFVTLECLRRLSRVPRYSGVVLCIANCEPIV